MTLTAQAILDELDAAMTGSTESWRTTALRRIADLYFRHAEQCSRDQIKLFDAVMCRLLKKMDRSVLADVSTRLGPIANPPMRLLQSLARHPDMMVHRPILEQSNALPEKDLAEVIDKDRVDQALLMKIADCRRQPGAVLIDVLIKRGNVDLQRKIIGNHDIPVSESSFARILVGINGDKEFAAAIAARNDVPDELRVWLKQILSE
jgi:uncharacterized protein (DUF2336 family)